MSLLDQVYPTNVSRADVSDPNDLLSVVVTWPEVWRDHFAEREATMAIDASHPYVPALREAFKDVVRVAGSLICNRRMTATRSNTNSMLKILRAGR